MSAEVRALVGEVANLSVPLGDLGDDTDLFDAGMSSLEAVSLVVALERKFGFRFDQVAIQIDTFRSIASIDSAVARARGRV